MYVQDMCMYVASILSVVPFVCHDFLVNLFKAEGKVAQQFLEKVSIEHVLILCCSDQRAISKHQYLWDSQINVTLDLNREGSLLSKFVMVHHYWNCQPT